MNNKEIIEKLKSEIKEAIMKVDDVEKYEILEDFKYNFKFYNHENYIKFIQDLKEDIDLEENEGLEKFLEPVHEIINKY